MAWLCLDKRLGSSVLPCRNRQSVTIFYPFLKPLPAVLRNPADGRDTELRETPGSAAVPAAR